MRTLVIIILSISILSCLENDLSISVSSIELGTSELLLRQFESDGDFINSTENPALVEASEVYSNVDTYLLIDIRSESDFAKGKIKNSVNVRADSLIDFLEDVNLYEFPKIVIISATGQHAAFCTSILRLLNYKNVYSLNFGIAVWNSYFSDGWLNSLNTDWFWFNHDNYIKRDFTPLPSLQSISDGETNEVILSRAKDLLALEFDEFCLEGDEKELTLNFGTLDFKYYTLVPD
ncbi:MAG: rhodanese-like domain-containing protein, partial [Melioribacteraceae bacterium]|nr:rhodanese-like domain-containing protein [Melioribacteraceae bacterium]